MHRQFLQPSGAHRAYASIVPHICPIATMLTELEIIGVRGSPGLPHENQFMLRSVERAHAGIGLVPDTEVLELAVDLPHSFVWLEDRVAPNPCGGWTTTGYHNDGRQSVAGTPSHRTKCRRWFAPSRSALGVSVGVADDIAARYLVGAPWRRKAAGQLVRHGHTVGRIPNWETDPPLTRGAHEIATGINASSSLIGDVRQPIRTGSPRIELGRNIFRSLF
jgi:hypothetical protein